MDYTVIQEHVNRLSDAMIAKGLKKPRAEFRVRAHEEHDVYLTWTPLTNSRFGGSDNYEFFRGGTPGEIFAKAAAFIEKMPNAEETRFREFMGALGNVIDLGRSNGIEVEFLNPLTETMKRLSENALTDQRAA